jgi:predicted amidohydrolase
VEQGAKLIFNISASPFEMGKPHLRYRMLLQHVQKHRVGVVYLNLVGGNKVAGFAPYGIPAIVIGVLGGFPGMTRGISERDSAAYWSGADVGIIRYNTFTDLIYSDKAEPLKLNNITIFLI